jgi:hypothetical protein
MYTDNRGTKRLYLYLGFILLAVALVGLAWSLRLLPEKQQNLELSPTHLQNLSPGVEFPAFLFQENRQLVLSYPAILRLGETGLLILRWDFPTPSSGSPAAGPRVLVETRLDLVGIIQNPTGSIDAPLFPGQALVLERQITGLQDGTYSGTLWSYIYASSSPISDPTGLATSDAFQPVAAQDIEVQIISLFGLDFFTARSMGVTCLVFSAGLIAYSLLGRSRKSRKKRSPLAL